MTSTNDGKDVKSNQTSGHKSKLYYIELYTSLEKALSSDHSLEERTNHVCEAWRRVYSLYQHSASSTHPHLLSWLQRHTANTVLQSKWAKSKNEQTRLTEAIDTLVAETTAASEGRPQHPWEQVLLQRAAWFRKAVENPWDNPVLKSLINPNSEPVTDQQVLEWVISEHGVVLVTRLQRMAGAGNCDDLALLLASAVMDRARAARRAHTHDHGPEQKVEDEDSTSFVAVLEREASFTSEEWEMLTDIELVLLLKTDKRPRCLELAKLTPLRDGYKMVERLRKRLEMSPRDKKLWKHAKEVATIVTQVVIARCMVLSSCAGAGRDALYWCARSLARLVEPARLRGASTALAAPAATARHLHTFCAALSAECKELKTDVLMKPFICELYVRAITAGMNELEQLKLKPEKESEARLYEQTLAGWFTQLGGRLTDSVRLRAECALTAFSVHPARKHYERVASTVPPARLPQAQEPTPESTSEYGSWANDSRTQSNLVKTSETLQLKQSQQHQANVLSTAILTEGEALGLEPELCQDLAVLLSGPRVKTLSWDTDREVLLENCRSYMEKTHGGTRAVTTELKYLNLDPNAYQHLPEEEDDENDVYYGIEKGYEHEVQLEEPEEIWQKAFFDPEQTESADETVTDQEFGKKKSKASVVYSEDEDPLSTIADAKKEKKRAKEKNKEHKRNKTHKRDDSNDGSTERRKDKDKKTKKERKKDKSEQSAAGSLNCLLGMKVAKVSSPVKDGEKRVRKKKERRRESTFSYVSVTDSDIALKSSQISDDPTVLVDGVFSMDELKSLEKLSADRPTLDNIKTTIKSEMQSPVINEIKTRPMSSPTVTTTSSDSDVTRAKSPYLTPNQLAHRHVVNSHVKSSLHKLLQFRRNQNKLRAVAKPAPAHSQTQTVLARPPSAHTPTQINLARPPSANTPTQINLARPSPARTPTQTNLARPPSAHIPTQTNLARPPSAHIPTQTSLARPLPAHTPTQGSSLVGMKIYNPEEVPKVYLNKKQCKQLETLSTDLNNILKSTADCMPRTPCKESIDELQSKQNVYNSQKYPQQYKNPVHMSQNVLSESQKLCEYRSPVKVSRQTMLNQSTNRTQTNYASPEKTAEHVRPVDLNVTPPKPTIVYHPLHKSMHNLSTKQELPKKPLLINDPNYFSQQHAKANASQLSPKIISNTVIKPPSQTTMAKDDFTKSQAHSNIHGAYMAKPGQNVYSQMTNLKSDLMRPQTLYEIQKLSNSMQNITEMPGSSYDTKRHIPTPQDMLHGRASHMKPYACMDALNPTQPLHSNSSAQTSRSGSIQNRERVDTKTPLTSETNDIDEFLKELYKSIHAGSDKNVSVALNKDVKLTMQTPSTTAKRTDLVTPQCAKQQLQQKKTENVPTTFARLSYMHKNKQNEIKLPLTDSINVELNKKIIEHKISKAKCQKNEITISRVGITNPDTQDPQKVIRRIDQSALKSGCPLLSSMLESKGSPNFQPHNNTPTTSHNAPDNLPNREDADLLLLLRNPTLMKPNVNMCIDNVSTGSSTSDRSHQTLPQTKVETQVSKQQVLVGTKVKNINILDTCSTKKESSSDDEWKRVMDAIRARKTEPLGPNALALALKKDQGRYSQGSSRSGKRVSELGQSLLQNRSSDTKKREHHSSKASSTTRHPSTDKHSEVPKKPRNAEVIKKMSSDMPKKLEVQNKQSSSNMTREVPHASAFPNSDFDMLDDLIDDDLRRELGEISSDEDAYTVQTAPVAKGKSHRNIPKSNSIVSKAPTTFKEKTHIVNSKTIIRKNQTNPSAADSLVSSGVNTFSTTDYPNVIVNNSSHSAATHIENSPPESKSETVQQYAPTTTIITGQVAQNTANNILTHMEANQYVNNILPTNVIFASVPQTAPVVVIRQELVYDPYPTIRIHGSQVNGEVCAINQNVFAVNGAPNLALYQTTQFAAPVINPIIIGNATTTTNVSNATAMGNEHVTQDFTKEHSNLPVEDSISLETALRLSDAVSETPEPSNLDFNMNRNCERKVLSLVHENHTNDVDKESHIQRLSNDDVHLKTEQDKERLKLKRQNLINRNISHLGDLPPIALTYTPLSKKLLQNESPKNGTVKPSPKLVPSTKNGVVAATATVTTPATEANNENIVSTVQASNATENKLSCRRIWLRSSNKITNKKVARVKLSRLPLNRNTIKLQVKDNDLTHENTIVTNVKNENKSRIKITTRTSNRILNSKIKKKNETLETQQKLADNNKLIDFEEELNRSIVLKSSAVMLETHNLEDTAKQDLESNDSESEQDKQSEAIKNIEVASQPTNKLEPTVVIEKLKNQLGDQIVIKSTPVKTSVKEATVIARNRNLTILANKDKTKDTKDLVITKKCVSNKIDVTEIAKTSSSEATGLPLFVDEANKLKSTVIEYQEIMKQTTAVGSSTLLDETNKLKLVVVDDQNVVKQKLAVNLPHKDQKVIEHSETTENVSTSVQGYGTDSIQVRTDELENTKSQILTVVPKAGMLTDTTTVLESNSGIVSPHTGPKMPKNPEIKINIKNGLQNTGRLPPLECPNININPVSMVEDDIVEIIETSKAETQQKKMKNAHLNTDILKCNPLDETSTKGQQEIVDISKPLLRKENINEVLNDKSANRNGSESEQKKTNNAHSNTDMLKCNSLHEILTKGQQETVDPSKPLLCKASINQVLNDKSAIQNFKSTAKTQQRKTKNANSNTDIIKCYTLDETSTKGQQETLNIRNHQPLLFKKNINEVLSDKSANQNFTSTAETQEKKTKDAHLNTDKLKCNQLDETSIKGQQETIDTSKTLLCKDNINEVINDFKTDKMDERKVADQQLSNPKQSNINAKPETQHNNLENIERPELQASSNSLINASGKNVIGGKYSQKTGTYIKGDINIKEVSIIDSNKKKLKLSLNGKLFNATISGRVDSDFDSLFEHPTMRAILENNSHCDGKRYTVNYSSVQMKNDPSKKIYQIKELHIEESGAASKPVETVNLISDDEDEVQTRSFYTEFGKYATNHDQETIEIHQKKFNQRCEVQMLKGDLFKSNRTKSKSKSLPLEKNSLLTRHQRKLLSVASSMTSIITEETDSKADKLTQAQTTPTPLLGQANTPIVSDTTDVIEIDDSSNDSLEYQTLKSDDIKNVEPTKVTALANLLLQDLGVETDKVNPPSPVKSGTDVVNLKSALLQDLGIVPVETPVIDITENDDEEEVISTQAQQQNINCDETKTVSNVAVEENNIIKNEEQFNLKKCVVKIVKCETLIRKHELMKKMKNCYVKMERLNNSILQTERVCRMTEKTSDIETHGINQDNAEDLIEFDVDEPCSSPQLSRCPSLSILNNWNDDSRPSLENPQCTSPVMEIYDTLIQLRNKLNTELVKESKLLLPPTCDSEWTMTKFGYSTQEIQSASSNVPVTENRNLLPVCDNTETAVQLIMTFETPKLITIILKFLEDNPTLLCRFEFARRKELILKINSTPNKLKRKAEDVVGDIVASKVLKLKTLALNTLNFSLKTPTIPIIKENMEFQSHTFGAYPKYKTMYVENVKNGCLIMQTDKTNNTDMNVQSEDKLNATNLQDTKMIVDSITCPTDIEKLGKETQVPGSLLDTTEIEEAEPAQPDTNKDYLLEHREISSTSLLSDYVKTFDVENGININLFIEEVVNDNTTDSNLIRAENQELTSLPPLSDKPETQVPGSLLGNTETIESEPAQPDTYKDFLLQHREVSSPSSLSNYVATSSPPLSDSTGGDDEDKQINTDAITEESANNTPIHSRVDISDTCLVKLGDDNDNSPPPISNSNEKRYENKRTSISVSSEGIELNYISPLKEVGNLIASSPNEVNSSEDQDIIKFTQEVILPCLTYNNQSDKECDISMNIRQVVNDASLSNEVEHPAASSSETDGFDAHIIGDNQQTGTPLLRNDNTEPDIEKQVDINLMGVIEDGQKVTSPSLTDNNECDSENYIIININNEQAVNDVSQSKKVEYFAALSTATKGSDITGDNQATSPLPRNHNAKADKEKPMGIPLIDVIKDSQEVTSSLTDNNEYDSQNDISINISNEEVVNNISQSKEVECSAASSSAIEDLDRNIIDDNQPTSPLIRNDKAEVDREKHMNINLSNEEAVKNMLQLNEVESFDSFDKYITEDHQEEMSPPLLIYNTQTSDEDHTNDLLQRKEVASSASSPSKTDLGNVFTNYSRENMSPLALSDNTETDDEGNKMNTVNSNGQSKEVENYLSGSLCETYYSNKDDIEDIHFVTAPQPFSDNTETVHTDKQITTDLGETVTTDKDAPEDAPIITSPIPVTEHTDNKENQTSKNVTILDPTNITLQVEEVDDSDGLDEISIGEIPTEVCEVVVMATDVHDIDIIETLMNTREEITQHREDASGINQNSEIKSPDYIDCKNITFNYHDYTKRPTKKQASTNSINSSITDCTKDNISVTDLNTESLSLKEQSSKNAPSCENITNKNVPLQLNPECKYELIQEDDFLTVITTENDEYNNRTKAEFVGPNVEKDTVTVASPCSNNADDINLSGFEFEDVYIFPLSQAGSNNSNVSNDSIVQELNTESVTDNAPNDLHDIDFHVKEPETTYSRKRKMNMRDVKVSAKKYRKSKNIDCSKQTLFSMTELAYSKEYKRLLEYWSSVKFSYSRPFHKEYIELEDLIGNWPINSVCYDVASDDVAVERLFVDLEDHDSYQPDPATQTFVEEISYEYNKSAREDSKIEASETNFNMGFGEGSGRVIQILKKPSESNISAATLSDVKQSQPVSKSVDPNDGNDITTSNDDQIKKIRHHVNFIELRDKVRQFFKKSTVELKSDWVQQKTKDELQPEDFPFGLCSLDYVKPVPINVIVQVVQVGQLPVSAAAQNPVTCDPRVTQVSDASPSQCSVDNSPNDDSQSEIKTEYTELTTADLSLPLQEYAQQNQASLASQDSNVELTEQTISFEMEIKAEESPEIKQEVPDIKEEKSNSSDTELHTLSNATPENIDYSFENNTAKSDARSVNYDSSEQNSSETFSQQRQQNGTSEKTDQIAHAMSAAGITTTPEAVTNTRAHALVNILSQKIRQGSINTTQTTTNTYSKTSINAMALQQALAQILPPPLNQTGSSENNQSQSTPVGPQVLHIVQGKNSSGNQITLVDNSQQSVISTPNATQVLHIVQNKNATPGQASNGTLTAQANSFSGLSLVDAGLQQGGNQLLHIVNTGNQKTGSPGQLLKRVNLLTNLTNVQGSNEQKMVQFVCKSADGKAIQLNAPHQRSMVLRLQPIETPNVQTPPGKPAESQELNTSPSGSTANKESASQQEIKSRSIYEENYAKFIQNSSSKTPGLEKSTSLPKFNQAFGKPVFQEGSQKQSETATNNSHLPPVNNNSENAECPANDNAINLEHMGNISSPPLLIRKPVVTTQSQSNIVQQIKQTIAPMNIQTMHGGVIYTRQIPVNIGGGQTINLITVPSSELINDDSSKTQSQNNQGEIEPSIIKIVPQSQTTTNNESSQEENNSHANGSNENAQTPQPQPVLTQMRIKLPMLSKAPQMVPGARVVRPSFFQIQRNVIGGANQPVYQQLVLTAAPPLGQQTIRLPSQASRPVKVPSENQSSTSESQMSSSTLEQLREFDMVLEQVKERSTSTPSANSNNSSFKIHTSSDTTDGNASSNCSTESTSQVLYSIGNNQSINVAYVNRKSTVTTPTTSTFVRSPDSTGIADSPTSSTHAQIPLTVTTDSSPTEMSSQSKSKVGSKSKSRPKSTSNPPNTLKLSSSVPPKTSSQKPLEDEQTTQRILYILAEYKEQVENSPDKDKPAPRRRSNPPSNPGSSKRKKSSSSRRSGTREMSPVHGEDTCRTMGSEDSSCGTSQGDCTESCLDSHSPQDSPRKVARKITFDQDLTVPQPRPQPQRNVIVADGQTITVARGTPGKPATAVLMPANYILPVSMVKGGQQIAIVTNRGPKLLTVGGEGGATNALLLQRLIGPAGLKPVLARPGVRHVRLPTAALHNLQAFNLATATTVQPPDSTASPTPGPTPPELVDTRATSSPWTDRDEVKPERSSSPEGSEPWNLPSTDAHDYTYEETVRTDNMDRTVLDQIPDRYSPDMEAQRIFDKMFDVDSKKSYAVDSPRCAYDVDPSDCDDKAYQVVQKKDGSQRQHRLAHVSAAALRHKYAILEHELRLQKSLSEECEDLGVDSPSASELFPEAELLFANSPAHEHNQEHHSHTPQPLQSSIPQPDMDDQIATDHLIPREIDVGLGLGDVGIVAVSEDGSATIALDQEEFARSHPNTTFHSEPTDGEVQPFTIAGIKGRHITSTIFHSNSAPATVLMTAPQATVISQAPEHGVKYEIENMINSMPSSHTNDINLSSVLVKDDGLTRFDSILTDSRELHLTNTASAIVHSSGNATQVIRRVCYEDDKRERDARYLIDEPDNLIAGDDAKMIAEDSSRDATLESMADGDDDGSSPERHAELFWESNSASERSEGRRPLDFSSDSDKCCKSPSFDETNSTDSSGLGAHMRLDSVIKEARGRGRERSRSGDGSSADDAHPPLRTYPPKRPYHPLDEAGRSVSGKTRAGEGAGAGEGEGQGRRRASGRGVVKRGCPCCNGSPAPPRPKKPRQRKPTLDFNTDN